MCVKREHINEFHSHPNSINSDIEFTIQSEGSIAFLDTKAISNQARRWLYHRVCLQDPFLECPDNLTVPKSRKLVCVLISNEVHFVSLADNFTEQLSKLLKLPSGMENKTAQRAQ